jgi:beta-lactamase regulating signal transducer with metallopeptidase domain
MTLELQTIAQYSALRIVDSITEGTLVAAFAAIVYRLARRQSAGTRFAIWFSALIAIAGLPLLGGLSIQSRVPNAIHRAAITIPNTWALYVFSAWAVIAGYFLVGVARAVWHLHSLRKRCTPLAPSDLPAIMQETLRRSNLSRKVVICTSKQVRVPTALGLARPAIVIPDWAMRELSPADVNQILLHELAHLRRWDDWTNLAQQLVRALFFFHPAIWWIENKAALEREIACDDAVLAETASPRAYAECLAHLAERSFIQRSLAMAQAAVGRLRETTFRVAQILDVNRPRASARGWKPAASLVVGFAVVCAVFAERSPKLIGFANVIPQAQLVNLGTSPVQDPSPELSPSQELPAGVHVTPAKLIEKPAPALIHHNKKTSAAHRVVLRPKAGTLVHLTSIEVVAPVPVAETLFVFFHNASENATGQPPYQIEMFRVMLVHYVVEPVSSQTPAKKT